MVDEEAGCDVKGRWVDEEEASWMKKERVTRALASGQPNFRRSRSVDVASSHGGCWSRRDPWFIGRGKF
jgi:hypothetical protein